jgi:tetratricopeptide (TPR) repeat protein
LLGVAGERALKRADVPAAISLLTRATALLPTSHARRAPLLLELGQALMKAGRFGEAKPVLERTLAAAREAGDRRTELRATIEREQLRSFTDPAAIGDEIASVASAVIPELEALDDDVGLAKAWRLLSDVHLMSSRFGARAEALERALEHARRVPGGDADTDAYTGLLAQALHWGPTPAAEGIGRCREFLEEAEDNSALRATVNATLGAMLASWGSFDEARELYGESVDLHEKLGLRFRAAVTALLGAEIEVLAGDGDGAERELRTAYETLEAMGESGARAVVSASLALVLADEGRDDEAWHFTRLAEEIGEPGDAFAEVLVGTAAARLHLRTGQQERAEARARQALELAQSTDSPMLQTTALRALAAVLESAGEAAEARMLLERALQVFEEKGNLVEARRLAAVLANASQRA